MARVPATAAGEELRDRHGGEPERVIQLAVSEQTAGRGDLGAVKFELEPAVESGSQRRLFGFTRHVPSDHVALLRSSFMIPIAQSGDNVTSHSTYSGNRSLE